jgi:hypothetical protein
MRANSSGDAKGVLYSSEARCRVCSAARPAAADEQRRPRLLQRLRLGRRVLERVVRSAEVDVLLGPEPVHDLELFGEHLQADGRLRKWEAVGTVLALHPAGADAELDPAARDVVDRRSSVCEQAGQPKGCG